ncbi:30S ribosomal protein S15 [Candidatus Berkelbacteria bacterium]|nr:30S ribosomal protein S15 [Candidatus Berkelbacteria bacterium]
MTALTTTKKTSKALAKTSKTAKAITPRVSASDQLIAKYQSHENDTGSTEVQIARVSQQITELTKHLKKHLKDNDSRRGLLIMLGKRRRLLNYLGRTNEAGYKKMIVDLKLRK